MHCFIHNAFTCHVPLDESHSKSTRQSKTISSKSQMSLVLIYNTQSLYTFSILINLHADCGEFTRTSLDDEVCLKVAVIYFITTSMLSLVHVRFVSTLGFFFPQIKHKSLPLLFILPFYIMVVSDLLLLCVERWIILTCPSLSSDW